MEFFVIEMTLFNDRHFAFTEYAELETGDAPRCPECNVLQPMPIDQKLTLLPVQKLTDIMTTYKLKKGKRRLCMMCRCANSCTRVVPKNRMIILSNYGLEENRKRGVFR
ncbi:hypothetical protein CBW65_04950 [Tumebacillus avium]|uniref:Uncharacterized protein n=1 Tax=Tumebacillus avium TaxID=1903704 RepID=A0A1Y0IMB6_9BACL|nr:hypothetical protein CBW65_04950 [Tumebacillus avium]